MMLIPRTLLLLLAATPAFAQQPATVPSAPSVPSTSTGSAAPAGQSPVSVTPPQMQRAVDPPQTTAAVSGTDRAEAYKGLITTLHEGGENKAAYAQMQSLPPNLEAQLMLDPDFLVTSAGIYAALGDNAYALRLLNISESRFIFNRQNVPLGVQIQECYLLLNLGDDEALHARLFYITQIAERAETLSEEQRNSLNNLWVYFALRRSNEESKAGNQRTAMRILITAFETYPDNVLVKRALAGAYLSAGDAKTSLQFYKEVGFADASPAEYQGAIGAALATGDKEDADKWVRLLLEKNPADPAVLTLAAKVEQAAGHRKLAAIYYRAALDNMPKEKAPPLNIPAKLRDQQPTEARTPPSSLTTLAAVTDPGGFTASADSDTARTIASAPTHGASRSANYLLPGERVAPVLVPIFIPQQSGVNAAAESTPRPAEMLPTRSTHSADRNDKTRPALRHRGSSATTAATSLDSYAPASAPSLYRFASQANERLGEYDPTR